MSRRTESEIINSALKALKEGLEGYGEIERFAIAGRLLLVANASKAAALAILATLPSDAAVTSGEQSAEYIAERSRIRAGMLGIRLQVIWAVLKFIEDIIIDRGRDE